jgi:hypothetical protein
MGNLKNLDAELEIIKLVFSQVPDSLIQQNSPSIAGKDKV